MNFNKDIVLISIAEIKKNTLRVFGFLFIRIFLIIAILVNLFSWSLALNIYNEIDSPQMALHYTVDFGIDYYGSSKLIFVLPGIGMILIFFNFILLLIFVKNKDWRFLSYLVLSAAILCNIVLLASLLSVYFLNFK